jgi:hypothetical protein
MTRHVKEADLALYASGDLRLLQRAAVGLHVRRCEFCRELLEEFRADRSALREAAGELPEGIDWAHLSVEMSANIRVGLEAGECVTPKKARPSAVGSWIPVAWRPLAFTSSVTLLLMFVLGAGWWLNTPAEETQALSRALHTIWRGGRKPINAGTLPIDRGPVIEASSDGIELRKDGGSLGVSQDSGKLITVSVSTQGSASARYVDQDSGQVTITSVYAQ